MSEKFSENKDNNIEIKKTDSKIKEGVDFVFEENPEIEKIGSKENYSEYLDTIFPESKVRNIVYHGTNINSYNAILKDNFDLNKSGSNLGYMGRIASFATTIGWTKNFANEKIVPALVNIESEYLDDSGNLTKYGLDTIKQKLIESRELPYFDKNIEIFNQHIEDSYDSRGNMPSEGFNVVKETSKLINYLIRDTERGEDLFNSIRLDLNIKGQKRNSDVVDMLSTEQIHILGSEQDIEGFKKFVENRNEKLDEKYLVK